MTSSLAIIAPTEPTKQRPRGEHESRRVHFERTKARGFCTSVRTKLPGGQADRKVCGLSDHSLAKLGFVLRLEAPVAAGDSYQAFSVGRMRIG